MSAQPLDAPSSGSVSGSKAVPSNLLETEIESRLEMSSLVTTPQGAPADAPLPSPQASPGAEALRDEAASSHSHAPRMSPSTEAAAIPSLEASMSAAMPALGEPNVDDSFCNMVDAELRQTICKASPKPMTSQDRENKFSEAQQAMLDRILFLQQAMTDGIKAVLV